MSLSAQPLPTRPRRLSLRLSGRFTASGPTVDYPVLRRRPALLSWWVDSSGRRNTLTEGVAMRAGRRRSDRALRAVLPGSPGRPGVAQRENRRRFWAAIAAGRASEAAAVEGGGSPAGGGPRVRGGGGLPPTTPSPSAQPPPEPGLVVAVS